VKRTLAAERVAKRGKCPGNLIQFRNKTAGGEYKPEKNKIKEKE